MSTKVTHDDPPTGLLIGGTWGPSRSGATLDVIDPATEQVIASVASATPEDVAEAVEQAQVGFREWRTRTSWERSAVLRKVATLLAERSERIASTMTAEQGKPLAEARAEVMASVDQFDWYADEARRIYGRVVEPKLAGNRIQVRREPVGIVAAFAAWNFPVLLPTRKIAPALAAGCAVIVKPAEEAPLSTLMVIEACVEAGVPAGAIQSLTGDPVMISELLLAAPQVRKVSLTGSVPVGQTVMRQAATGIKEISLELGGHAPVIVFPDADIAEAATACVAAKFRNTGQVCASPSRFFVHESIVDEFSAAFVAAARDLRVGAGDDPDTTVGPLTNVRRIQEALALVEDARDKGAVVALGGNRTAGRAVGYYFDPTVLTGVTDEMQIMSAEPFAPVAPIVSFATVEEVLERANSTDYGLASYVFTNDLATAFLVSEGLEAGMVGVNTLAIATAEAPFGGVKMSGFGREGGIEGVQDYTVAKYVNFKIG
jgi:succinate-semialdehyde dehydrogenase/glutarate-semialdehyde dehydrogenase